MQLYGMHEPVELAWPTISSKINSNKNNKVSGVRQDLIKNKMFF
jgi:hypothetical protein